MGTPTQNRKRVLVSKPTALLLLAGAVLVLAGTALAAAGGGTPRLATLKGSQTTDPDGSGSAVIRVNLGKHRVCWQLSVTAITLPATAAHIHVGAAGVNGPVAVTLSAPDATGKAAGCTTVNDQTLLKNLIQKPGDYYVNVHNGDFPGGAVRGQLGKPGAPASASAPGKPAAPGPPTVKPGKPVKQ
jgi:hypothetical protein